MNKKVVIFQHRLLHYRVDFFQQLKEKCEKNNIELHLVYGQASEIERKRDDEGVLDWANKVKNKYFSVMGRDLLWQPFPDSLRNSDLVVLMQENRIISNYPFFIFRKILTFKIAYWGHGVNFQSRYPKGLREQFKKYLLNKVDWWFAYTKITSDLLVNANFPKNKITCLNNAIDVKGFKHDCLSISDSEINGVKNYLNIPKDAKIGIFCGSLYKDKKLNLLLASVEEVRKRLDFHLLVLGSGPEMGMLKEYATKAPWIHVVGVKKGRNKALYYKMSDVMLNPGLLGLHILDSFSIGIPLVSTRNSRHSPEIAYLENGKNGLLTEDSVFSYSQAILHLLGDDVFYKYVSDNALASGELYTLENMVDNFIFGIKKALEL